MADCGVAFLLFYIKSVKKLYFLKRTNYILGENSQKCQCKFYLILNVHSGVAHLKLENSLLFTQQPVLCCHPVKAEVSFCFPIPLHRTPVLLCISFLCSIALWWFGGLQVGLQLAALFDDRPDLILLMAIVNFTRLLILKCVFHAKLDMCENLVEETYFFDRFTKWSF